MINLKHCGSQAMETKRLILRPFKIEDADDMFNNWASNDNVTKYLTWPTHTNIEITKFILSEWVKTYEDIKIYHWAIVLKQTNEVIGDCGLTMQNIHNVIKPEIGYHIRKDMQRKGYAKEAAIAVRDWTFTNTPFKQIYSYMKYTNDPSNKTAVSWGCHFQEEYNDEVNIKTKVYMITKEEWQNIKNK